MSAYINFTACVSDVVEQFITFIEDNQGATVGDFFNYDPYKDLVNDLVVTYHDEVFSTAGNNFLASERVPVGIVTLAKKRGVKFPRGFSIKNDKRAYDVFLMRINDYREARGLTKERVKEIRDQTAQVTAHEEERRKRVRISQ
jgi:hypothetical protein